MSETTNTTETGCACTAKNEAQDVPIERDERAERMDEAATKAYQMFAEYGFTIREGIRASDLIVQKMKDMPMAPLTKCE